MIEVTIDGRKTEVEPGTTILAAARKAGIAIPALCHSAMVEAYGACRVCSVEVDEGRRKRSSPPATTRSAKPVEVVHPQRARAAHPPPGARDDAGALAQREGRAGRGGAGRRRRAALRPPAAQREPERLHPLRPLRAALRRGRAGTRSSTSRGAAIAPRDHALRRGRSAPASAARPAPTSARPARSRSSTTRTTRSTPSASAARARSSRARWLLLDKHQCHMREIGTAHLVEIMDDYDLLPVHNYRFG